MSGERGRVERRLVRVLILAFATIATALWLPRLARLGQAPGAIVERRQFLGADYEFAAIDPRHFTVRIDRRDGGMRLDGASALRTNAGIFEPDLTPTGLLIVDGHQLHPLNRDTGTGNFFLQPNGVFLIGDHGARVVATEDFQSAGVRHATQSGPLLVQRGTLNPNLPADSTHRFTRSGVGLRDDGTVIFAIARDEVTLHAFARFFREGLGCRDALYLDGAISGLATQGSALDEEAGPFAAVIRADRRP